MKLRWVLIGAAAGALFVAERLRPLRLRKDPAPGRVGRNLTIGLLGAATTAASEIPMIAPVQRFAERRRLGLLRQFPLPGPLRIVVGLLLLDYTLFIWHWLNHRVPALWRFHAVHHIDIDLDSTTGVRFHFGELALGAGFRAVQVVLLGVDNVTLRVFQQVLLLSVIFQHSNLDLPAGVERGLLPMVVTPRMHGVHHSTRVSETNTNFSSLLSWWDRLHGTLRLDVPQSAITIGVAGFLEPDDVTLEQSLALPFRNDARLQADSRDLQRPESTVSP